MDKYNMIPIFLKKTETLLFQIETAENKTTRGNIIRNHIELFVYKSYHSPSLSNHICSSKYNLLNRETERLNEFKNWEKTKEEIEKKYNLETTYHPIHEREKYEKKLNELIEKEQEIWVHSKNNFEKNMGYSIKVMEKITSHINSIINILEEIQKSEKYNYELIPQVSKIKSILKIIDNYVLASHLENSSLFEDNKKEIRVMEKVIKTKDSEKIIKYDFSKM